MLNRPLNNLIGQIPSPYGTMIDVFFDRSRHVDEDNCYFHSAEGCMDMAGVHGKENREACYRGMKKGLGSGGISFDLFLKHGGRKVQYVPLPKPKESVYRRFEFPLDVTNVVENWVDLVMDQPSWQKRAAALLSKAIPVALEQYNQSDLPPSILPPDLKDVVVALSTSHLLTSALEHLPDTEIDCIEAAAIYAVSLHDEWRLAGLEWLEPVRGTWLADWIAARKPYRDIAKAMLAVDPSLPRWLYQAKV